MAVGGAGVDWPSPHCSCARACARRVCIERHGGIMQFSWGDFRGVLGASQARVLAREYMWCYRGIIQF